MTCSTQTQHVETILRFEEKKLRGDTHKSYRSFHAEYLEPRGYTLSESALIKHIYHCVRPNVKAVT